MRPHRRQLFERAPQAGPKATQFAKNNATQSPHLECSSGFPPSTPSNTVFLKFRVSARGGSRMPSSSDRLGPLKFTLFPAMFNTACVPVLSHQKPPSLPLFSYPPGLLRPCTTQSKCYSIKIVPGTASPSSQDATFAQDWQRNEHTRDVCRNGSMFRFKLPT